MVFRVIYTAPGHFAPDHHDFAYLQPAEDWAALCREAGRSRVEVVEFGGDADSEPLAAPVSDLGTSGGVVGRFEGREALRDGAERIEENQ